MKDWTVNEILTEPDLEAEFDRIYNNALALISPLTGNLDFGASRAIGLSLGSVINPSVQPTGDTNTGVYFSAADTVDIATGGVRAANFGASFLLAAAPEDARTNTVDVVGILRSTTSGIATTGIGTGLQFDAENAAGTLSTFGRLDFVGTNVTAGSEATVLDILLRTAGAAEASRYRFQATGAFLGTLTHAITANRTWTIPDQSGTFSLGLLDRDVTTATVSNTVVETTVYSFSVPGGTISTNNALRATLIGDYLDNHTGLNTITIRVKYGATTIYTAVLTTGATNINRGGLFLSIVLSANNATNVQVSHGVAWIGPQGTAAGTAAAIQSGPLVATHNAIPEDSMAAKTLAITYQLGAANANLDARALTVDLELLGS